MENKELDLLRKAIFYPEDNTYRFTIDDFQKVWDAFERKTEGEGQ